MSLALLPAVGNDRFVPRETPVREYVAGGRIKGSILRAHLRWAREQVDPEAFRAMLDCLPPARISDLAQVLLSTTWYPLQWLVDLDRAIVTTIGEGKMSVLAGPGRFSASATFRQLHDSLLRDDPHSFFRHVALLQSHFTDFGASTWERLGASSGRMTHRYWRCFSPLLCQASIGFYEECVQLSGGVGITVNETSCQCRGDKHCSFDVRWRG